MLVDWQVLLLVAPVMVFAGLVHGALGLGFPMVATPIIAVFLDVKLAILITLLPTTVVNVASISRNGSVLSIIKKYRVLAITSLGGAVVGAVVLTVTDASPFRLLLALLIILFLCVSQYGLLPRQWCRANPVLALVVVGLVSGFSGGTTNVMVAILLIYFLAMEVARAEMVSAMNLCFLLGKVSQIAVFYSAGLLSAAFIASTIPLAACAYGALVFGQKVGEKIPQDRYRKFLHVLLAVLAIILIGQFLFGK